MKPVRYKPAPTRIRPSARRRKPERKGIQITASSEVSPGVQRPARDALVVSALCCVCSVVATDEGEHGQAKGDERPIRKLSQGDQEDRGKCIRHQHIAIPEQEVEDADQQQQRVSPQVQQDCAPSSCAGAVDEENHARAEQHRKQPHELLVDEDFAEDADGPVKPCLGAARAQVVIVAGAELEGYGVHEEDAEHRDPSNQVEADDALGLLNGAGIGRGNRCQGWNSLEGAGTVAVRSHCGRRGWSLQGWNERRGGAFHSRGPSALIRGGCASGGPGSG